MTAIADFGPLLASVDVDDAVLATLQGWLPTYLGRLQQERGVALPLPKAYASVVEEDQFLDHNLPAVLAAAAKTTGSPQVMNDGTYSCNWLVAVSVVVRGRVAKEAKRTGSLYEAAVRQTILQQLAAVDSVVAECRWLGGGEVRPLQDQISKGRFLVEGASQYSVATDFAVGSDFGPAVPDENPYADLPTVQTVTTSIDLKESP